MRDGLLTHSGSYDKYPEDNAAATYGLPGPDPYGDAFPDFEYASSVVS
jgi:hypothetical protein